MYTMFHRATPIPVSAYGSTCTGSRDFVDEGTPVVERARMVAAVEPREQATHRRARRQDQVKQVQVPVGSKQRGEVMQDPPDVGRLDVMQEAVRQDEVIRLAGGRLVLRDVGHQVLAAMACARVGDVLRVHVDAEVVSRRKVLGVGAGPASHVEDPTYLGHVVGREHGGELAVGERPLPQPVCE